MKQTIQKKSFDITITSPNEAKDQAKSNTSVVFTGHFDIGENISKEMRLTVEESKKNIHNKFVVLVGDIGVSTKIKAFTLEGYEGIKKAYYQRIQCTKSSCVLSQLPINEQQIQEIFNVQHYEKIINILKIKCGSSYLSAPNFNEVLLSDAIPMIVNERLHEYGISPSNTIILSERKLRNIAIRRLKLNSKKSWRSIPELTRSTEGFFLGTTRLTNAKGVPICRAITFAMNEYFALNNFKEIKYYVKEKQYASVLQGWLIFEKHQYDMPYIKTYIDESNFPLIH